MRRNERNGPGMLISAVGPGASMAVLEDFETGGSSADG
jgi:hypothetical protein